MQLVERRVEQRHDGLRFRSTQLARQPLNRVYDRRRHVNVDQAGCGTRAPFQIGYPERGSRGGHGSSLPPLPTGRQGPRPARNPPLHACAWVIGQLRAVGAVRRGTNATRHASWQGVRLPPCPWQATLTAPETRPPISSGAVLRNAPDRRPAGHALAAVKAAATRVGEIPSYHGRGIGLECASASARGGFFLSRVPGTARLPPPGRSLLQSGVRIWLPSLATSVEPARASATRSKHHPSPPSMVREARSPPSPPDLRAGRKPALKGLSTQPAALFAIH